ncbi:Serine/threonine-protein phosphatase 2A activator 2 [Orbilia ellipsospora]|uniref:Serine/threonine-protein phosphatase 2A activator n=1 Tax=Orbilia ellipsospora TaxID=2528407 RepID=A0AAV9X4B0_9PEZI
MVLQQATPPGADALKLPAPRKPRQDRTPAIPSKPSAPLSIPSKSSLTFATPIRRIVTPSDLELFHASPTYRLLVDFVLSLNEACLDKSLKNSLSYEDETPVIKAILDALKHVERVVKENPRVDNGGSRFGNQGFRDFYDALEKGSKDIHEAMNLDLKDGAITELSTYLLESFGNRTRIDYGSGHELNFICWLLCLHQLSLLPTTSLPSIPLHVFPTYLSIMRHIQQEYYLEPAGSHGVWGLDDYQFLPFVFGSAQLFHHPYLRPISIHNPELLDELSAEYMYLDCIRFINSIKTTANLRWHSPMLDDISSAKSWGKVNVGMVKMWEKEVVGKLPVMQHFLFGGILAAVEGIGVEEEGLRDVEETMDGEGAVAGRTAEEVKGLMERLDREGMRHVHSSWGECCGIKVPTAIAAREQGEKGGLRSIGRLPFD